MPKVQCHLCSSHIVRSRQYCQCVIIYYYQKSVFYCVMLESFNYSIHAINKTNHHNVPCQIMKAFMSLNQPWVLVYWVHFIDAIHSCHHCRRSSIIFLSTTASPTADFSQLSNPPVPTSTEQYYYL